MSVTRNRKIDERRRRKMFFPILSQASKFASADVTQLPITRRLMNSPKLMPAFY
jgi:hypothetical protein